MNARRSNDTSTHSLTLADGTDLCVRTDHGMTFIDIKRPGARVWSSNRVDRTDLGQFGRRAAEIAAASFAAEFDARRT